MSGFARSTRLIAVCSAAALVSVAGCSKDKGGYADTPAKMPAATGVSVVDIDMGRHIGPDKKITDKTDDFAPSDTIYGSIHTSGTATNVAVVGRWTFENGTAVDERTNTISPTGDANTEFHVMKPGGWPKGKYTLHILIDGKEVRTKDVTVK